MEDSNFAQRGSFPLGVGVQNLITSSTQKMLSRSVHKLLELPCICTHAIRHSDDCSMPRLSWKITTGQQPMTPPVARSIYQWTQLKVLAPPTCSHAQPALEKLGLSTKNQVFSFNLQMSDTELCPTSTMKISKSSEQRLGRVNATNCNSYLNIIFIKLAAQ